MEHKNTGEQKITEFNQGFSLVETMIAVSIVSLLAAGGFKAAEVMNAKGSRAQISDVLNHFAATSTRAWHENNQY